MLDPKSPRALPGKIPLSSPEAIGRVRCSGTSHVWILLASLVFLAAGCADTMAGASLEQDVAQLRQDLDRLTLSVHRSKGDTETVLNQLERRTRDQQGESQKQLAALSSRTDALERELAGVSTRVEEASRRIEQLSRMVKAAPATRVADAPRPSPGAAPSSAAGSQPAQVYQAAYIDFSKGNYLLAISGFREFLRMFPDSDLADNAQYWIGEAHFSLARAYATQGQPDKVRPALEQAVQEFRKVIVNYPRGDKAPTALYKEALALLELKQQGLARVRLQYLVDHFPQSEETPLARERLAALKDSKESEER